MHLREEITKKAVRRTKSGCEDDFAKTRKKSNSVMKQNYQPSRTTNLTGISKTNKKLITTNNPFSQLKSTDSGLYKELLKKAKGKLSTASLKINNTSGLYKQPVVYSRKSNFV